MGLLWPPWGLCGASVGPCGVGNLHWANGPVNRFGASAKQRPWVRPAWGLCGLRAASMGGLCGRPSRGFCDLLGASVGHCGACVGPHIGPPRGLETRGMISTRLATQGAMAVWVCLFRRSMPIPCADPLSRPLHSNLLRRSAPPIPPLQSPAPTPCAPHPCRHTPILRAVPQRCL